MDDRTQRARAAGVPPSPPAEERRRRRERLGELFAARDLDGLVVYGSGPTNPDPVRYLSGYVHPFPRARSVLVVPADGAAVVLVDRAWHLPAAREMAWVDDVRLMPTPTAGVSHKLADVVGGAINDCGLDDSVIGLLGIDVPTVVEAAVAGTASDVDPETGAAVWDALVATPSEYDLRTVERTAAIADEGLAALADACEAGRSERAVCFDVLSAMASSGAEFQHANSISTHVDVGAYAQSESNLQPFLYTETPLEVGEQFWVDVIACHEGYYVDCDRTVAVGEPTAEQRRIYNACAAMYDAMLAAVEPGVTGHAVWQAARDVAAEYGYADHLNGVYLGHTTGLTISTSPVVARDASGTLTEGQLLNIEPGIHVPDVAAACIENTLQVTADGPRVLNDAPVDLIVV
ncbi:Xaa-Pro peptidase family protein [Halolamina sp.]|jgi:Xaa-Pro aminopeptidase|uniref:M24 family metallopeptidase n=1 Tax=Halolamina sp. TaxID=1940283 RepID=UPI000223BF97|nr:peptidase M24 [halophilic archaeon DL31]